MGAAKNAMIEQMLGISKDIVTCKHCNKKYRQETTDQMAGCRDMEYDICPYCHGINGSSMEEEYCNYKID